MMCLFGDDFSSLTGMLSGFSSDDAAIKSGIADAYGKYGYIADPHTATGYNAACACGADGILLSTAHPAKFRDIVLAATGTDVPIPDHVKSALSRERKFTVLPSGDDMFRILREWLA